MSNIDKIRQEIERRKGYISVTHFAEELLAFIDSLSEESKDIEQAAARYERDNRQMPLPEDTMIFQRGVAEGRRLEREDNNKALAEMYGYEGGADSPLVKIAFTIPKEHFKRLMPIKQGDVFGIENQTNKEGIR